MTEISAIKLLVGLHKTKAPLNTYESVMHWHLTTVGKIHERQRARQSSNFVAWEKLFGKLQKRYKYDKLYHQVTKITLPYSKAKAQIVWNDAKEVMTLLLTDPRITNDHYLFFKTTPMHPHLNIWTSLKMLTWAEHTLKCTRSLLQGQVNNYYCLLSSTLMQQLQVSLLI